MWLLILLACKDESDGSSNDTQPVVEDCGDATDNDGDGLADCRDPDCPPCTEDCQDGDDNDGDGDVDCLDSDCKGTSSCTEDCSDGKDNDMDGDTDCQDYDCQMELHCEELICDDELDNEGDGDTDCEDDDCDEDPFCDEALHCADGVDNDVDGRVDCEDRDCRADVNCPESFCDDGVDNDADGLIDCEDADCMESCTELDCSDGNDNDKDGYRDCDDEDCIGDSSCANAVWIWLDEGQGTMKSRRTWGNSSGSFATGWDMDIYAPTGRAVVQTSFETHTCTWAAASFEVDAWAGPFGGYRSADVFDLSSSGRCSGLLKTSHFRGRGGTYASTSTGFKARFEPPRFYANDHLIVDGSLSSSTSTLGNGVEKLYYQFTLTPSNPWPRSY